MTTNISRHSFLAVTLLCLLLTSCGGSVNPESPTPTLVVTTPVPTVSPTATSVVEDLCPANLSQDSNCYTPHEMRLAYGMEGLIKQGFTGKGQTVIDIVSFGSPTLQQDMDVFDQQFGLPLIHIQVLSPLGTVPFDPTNRDMLGWQDETNLDVQIIHAIAPAAAIVVMTSPVDETEGTVGLPQMLQLEQYAVAHQLGHIFLQSFVVSEATLADRAGRQLVQQFDSLYQQITQHDGFTIVNASGDNGATDWANIAATKLAPAPTVNFPPDDPWVTAVGGTTLIKTTNGYSESAWSGSGGGMSKFFVEPAYQKGLSQAIQSQLAGQRGLPDIAADADPRTGMAFYVDGQWAQAGGTSASAPLWAAIVAVADQMAGHPLGFINPGLYKLGLSTNPQQAFRDVTSGDNSVNNGSVHVQGFQAVPGWDAVTGWGAPLASQLIPDLIAALKA